MLHFRTFFVYLLSLSIVSGSIPASIAQSVSTQQVNCNVSSEAEFRISIETIIKNVIGDSLRNIDYKAIVDKSWKETEADALIDRLVDENVKRVRDEKSLYDLVVTLGSSEAREKLAQELAEGVYGSADFKHVVGVIANDVGKAISAKLDSLTTQATSPIAQCISRFVGPQYGDTIALFVTQQTRNEISVDPSKSKSGAGVTDIIAESTGGLTGGLLIVLRRAIVSRLSQWLGQRLVGTIVTRAIGAAVSVIGWLLVAKELWDLRHGVLPIIAKEMKSDKTKAQIRTELVKGLDTELSKALDSIPRDVAAGIFDIWQNFKEKNAKVLELAKKFPEFRTMLKSLESEDEKISLSRLRKTNDLVNLALDQGGEDEFLKLLGDGRLKKGILDLTETGVRIALETKSIDTAFLWSKTAKDDLQGIYDAGLHKYADPQQYDGEKLKRLISLRDERTIKRFASLETKERDILFELPPEQFREFVKNLTSDQLASLSYYIQMLQPDVSRSFVSGVRENPDKMKLFSRSLVQQGVVNSRDQGAAIKYMLRSSSPLDILQLPADIRLAASGDINPILLWSKEPITITVAAFLSLMLFMMLFRMIFGRRPKIIVINKEK